MRQVMLPPPQNQARRWSDEHCMSQASAREQGTVRVKVRRQAACGVADGTVRRAAARGARPLLRGLNCPAIEHFEQRVLFSVPAAALAAAYPDPVAGQAIYTFTVNYADPAGIDTTSLGNNNLNVV